MQCQWASINGHNERGVECAGRVGHSRDSGAIQAWHQLVLSNTWYTAWDCCWGTWPVPAALSSRHARTTPRTWRSTRWCTACRSRHTLACTSRAGPRSCNQRGCHMSLHTAPGNCRQAGREGPRGWGDWQQHSHEGVGREASDKKERLTAAIAAPAACRVWWPPPAARAGGGGAGRSGGLPGPVTDHGRTLPKCFCCVRSILGCVREGDCGKRHFGCGKRVLTAVGTTPPAPWLLRAP